MAMLETVIVLPLVLLLLFGLIEFGIMFGRWLMVNNAAREGARQAIVFRQNCSTAQVESDVIATVQAYTDALGVSLPGSGISVNGQCAGGGSASTVSVTLPFTFEVLPGLATGIGPTISLIGSSVMRNEGP
jgi:Flp pilus assembly protein TadG